MTFFKAQEGKGWHSSDNPVILDNNKQEGIEMLPADSVLYFPLTPDYLAFIHYRKSKDKTNPFRKYKPNKVHEVSDKEMDYLTKILLSNAGNYVILPSDLNWRK